MILRRHARRSGALRGHASVARLLDAVVHPQHMPAPEQLHTALRNTDKDLVLWQAFPVRLHGPSL